MEITWTIWFGSSLSSVLFEWNKSLVCIQMDFDERTILFLILLASFRTEIRNPLIGERANQANVIILLILLRDLSNCLTIHYKRKILHSYSKHNFFIL